VFGVWCLVFGVWCLVFGAWVLKYVATSAIGLTFCVVIFVLGPGLGGWNGIVTFLTSGPMVYTHLLCPILCMLSFTILEYKREVSSKTILFFSNSLTVKILHSTINFYPSDIVYPL
jgi:hypothetical protein